MRSEESLSISQDDYLDLGVREPSASTMVKRLAQVGLLERGPYRGFVLTDAGRMRAEHIHERHQVLAAFFEAIGVAAHTATCDIDGIEHCLSDETVAALKRVTRKLKCE